MHLLHNAVSGDGWIKKGKTIELRTNSGRNRLNILGAYSPDENDLVNITSTDSCDGEMVQKLLESLSKSNPNKKLALVLDNARYNHTPAVKELAGKLNIELFYLPTYSPNLNLIERFWKFLKKKTVRNRYYATFSQFEISVKYFLDNVSIYSNELSTLLTENFHLYGSN